MSAVTTSTLPGHVGASRSATDCVRALSRPTRTRSAPVGASMRTVSSPSPEVGPVTAMRLPRRSNVSGAANPRERLRHS